MSWRVRNTCRRGTTRSEERLQRFLKPGALARLRDSKICARLPRSVHISSVRISPPGSPGFGVGEMQIEGLEGDQIRFFGSRVWRPRILQRKKLDAAKYVFFAPPSPDPSDSLVDLVGVDIVVAH